MDRESKKELSLTGIKGAIFDMDGTMIDNQPYHRKAWLEFAKRRGFDWTEEEIREKTSGKKNGQILPQLLQKELIDEDIHKLANEKEEIYRELYTSNIEPIEGLLDIIKELKERGIKIAVATTAQKNNRDFILGGLGIEEMLDGIVGEENFTKGKPDPELLLKAAEKIRIAPSECIMFDDAPIGVEAAHRAGMKIVCLTTTHTQDEFHDADLLINTFNDLKLTC